MRSAREMFPVQEGQRLPLIGPDEYLTIIQELGSILIAEPAHDGEPAHFLLKAGDRYGHTKDHFDTCAHLDVLRECTNYAAIDRTIGRIEHSVFWTDSLLEMCEYLHELSILRDYGGGSALNRFLLRVITLGADDVTFGTMNLAKL